MNPFYICSTPNCVDYKKREILRVWRQVSRKTSAPTDIAQYGLPGRKSGPGMDPPSVFCVPDLRDSQSILFVLQGSKRHVEITSPRKSSENSRKRRSVSPEELYQSSGAAKTRRRREGSGVFPRKIIVGLASLAILLFFLPAIVVRTPLKQVLIDRLLADFNGRVTVENLSCGWISNTELRNIVATDLQGQELFRIKTIRLRKSLTSLINATDLGTIEVIEPIVDLKLRPDGSNLEDAISEMFATSDRSQRSLVMRFSVSNGRVLVTDESTESPYTFENVTCILDVLQPDEAPLRIEFSATVAHPDRNQDGQINARIAVDGGKDDVEFQNGLIELTTDSLPVAFVSPFISRFIEPVSISGTLDGKATGSWKDFGSTVGLQMESATFADLSILAPGRIGKDEIRLNSAILKGNLVITADAIQADRLVCQTDLGYLKANGRIDREQIVAITGARIPDNNFQAEGLVNLAPLINMLPDTFPLQSGLQIESGTLQFNANSRIEGTDRRLVVNLESAGLTAIQGGKRLNWDKPARIVAAIRQTSDNTTYIESLDCTTNFMRLSGTATSEQGEFTIQGNLKAAVAEVNQFFDLGGLQLEGIVDGKFAWQFEGNRMDKLASRPLRAGGTIHIDSPVVNVPGHPNWTQDEMDLVVQMAGQRLASNNNDSNSIRLNSGKFEFRSGNQTFEANLAQPLTDPSVSSTWMLDCKISGGLEPWMAQLSYFVPLNLQVKGNIEASALVGVASSQVVVHRSSYELTDVEFDGYGWAVNEPQVGGEANLTWSLGTGVLQIANATMASSAFSVRVDQAMIDTMADSGSALSGRIAFLADINRCLSARKNKGMQDQVQWFGRAQGTISIQTSPDSIGGGVDIRFTDVVAARHQLVQRGVQNVSSSTGTWRRLLEEKEVILQSSLQLSRSLDELMFNNTQLDASSIKVIASGTVSDLAGTLVTNIQGSWNPDWEKLKPLADSLLQGIVTLNDVQGGAFQLNGPIINPRSGEPGQSWIHHDLNVATVASWRSGKVLDMPIGGSRLDLRVADGIASLQSDSIPFSGGTVSFSPRLDMRGPEMILSLPPGNLVENIELTPEMCRGWLMYVAPVVADATAAQGRLSIETSDFRIPLGRTMAANIQGTATLHQATFGLGPLGQQLIGMVGQVKALAKGQPWGASITTQDSKWLTMPEQKVAFAVVQGRVHHQGMQFQIDDVTIQTSGSVGLDQTLQLVAHIPINDQWIGNNRWTQGLKGQTLPIPSAARSLVHELTHAVFNSYRNSLFNERQAPRLIKKYKV